LVSSHNLRELEDVCDHVGIMNHGKVLLQRSLSDLQDNTVKLQVAFRDEEEPTLPAELQILHRSHVGRVYTYIIRGNVEHVCRRMQICDPLLMEAIPLTLEEIFIYEMGGADYAVRDIVL
ncbi:MAG: ABC transporter ATP-binding protein, partial [Oscillospiraceae bacterium]|nr:ABC transporter ATP-binding protein [Oscillospiraceae bacterium]